MPDITQLRLAFDGYFDLDYRSATAAESCTIAFRSAELEVLRQAIDLGAEGLGGPLTPAEQRLAERARASKPTIPALRQTLRTEILSGGDPLGTALCRLRSPAERRRSGAFYTPPQLVAPMLNWALSREPDRLVDLGCGSGRFAAGAVRRRPDLTVVAIDIDPLATLLTRATLAVLGARDAVVIQADYTTFELPRIAGRTGFVGNPPYVRHHDLSPAQKKWAVATGKRLGYRVSGLAGLHAHFFLATAVHAQPGDIGCLVTSAEWLDVNYGSIIRSLLLDRLGGQQLHVIDPTTVPFEDAMTTAAIACFTVGTRDPIRFRLVADSEELSDLEQGREIARQVLAAAARWTPLLRAQMTSLDRHPQVQLRGLARVHRGVATGANGFFILTRERARALGIEAWCRPAITSGEEILRAGGVVRDGPERRLLLDVAADIDRKAHPQLDAYLRLGEYREGGKPAICDRYLPSHRRPWWYLGRSVAPPIVATYMARQAPVFALNPDGLALVNIAHGVYPRSDMSSEQLASLVNALNGARASFRGNGRTYHGGLEKFEPREMEGLLIPAVGDWQS